MLDFSKVITCDLSNVANLSFSYDGSGNLVVDASYNSSLQNSNFTLMFAPSVQEMAFFATPSTSMTFTVDPSNNIAADYY
jgi:hypothetical protein